MTTASEKHSQATPMQGDGIVDYLTTLLGDNALAYDLVSQSIFLLRSLGEEEQSQRYRLASTIAVELVRAQTRNTGENSSRVLLQESALKRMPLPWSQALRLYMYEGASYSEIGERQGITEGTAHTHVCRAKRWLWAVLPSLSYEDASYETKLSPFLSSYLRRLLDNDEQARQMAINAIECASRRRTSKRLTPYERLQGFYLAATELAVNTLHEQAIMERGRTLPLLMLRVSALEGMPERFCRALLFYAQGEGYAHIAKREAITCENAVGRVSMARTWLREHLVPSDELAAAIVTLEWAECGGPTHREGIREMDLPDFALPLREIGRHE